MYIVQYIRRTVFHTLLPSISDTITDTLRPCLYFPTFTLMLLVRIFSRDCASLRGGALLYGTHGGDKVELPASFAHDLAAAEARQTAEVAEADHALAIDAPVAVRIGQALERDPIQIHHALVGDRSARGWQRMSRANI